jgi:hypothetical protein
LLRASR